MLMLALGVTNSVRACMLIFQSIFFPASCIDLIFKFGARGNNTMNMCEREEF